MKYFERLNTFTDKWEHVPNREMELWTIFRCIENGKVMVTSSGFACFEVIPCSPEENMMRVMAGLAPTGLYFRCVENNTHHRALNDLVEVDNQY